MRPAISLIVNKSESPFIVLSLQGDECLSRDYAFNLNLECSGQTKVNAEEYLNQACEIVLNINQQVHRIHGVISSLQQNFTSNLNQQRFEMCISSILHSTQSTLRSAIYINQTALDVISETLDSHQNLHHHMAAVEPLPSKTFIHQFKESDFNFINRLCEHWGIYYYFDHEDDDKLIFADDNQYPIDERIFEFIEQPSLQQVNHAITSLNSKVTPSISHIVVEGRNPENDMLLIQSEAGTPSLNQATFTINNIGIDNEAEAELLAQRKLEQSQSQSAVYSGTTAAIGLKPGFVIQVHVTPNSPLLELLIVEIKHSALNLDHCKNEHGEEYLAHFKAIPASQIYRPEPLTPKPNAISSTARIFSSYESPSISHRDKLGRYQVMFDYMSNKKVSHWIRRSLTAAKDNHLDIPLLPGTEVQISYLGGNPDLPYIDCALENSQSTRILSNNENPYTANLSTSGLLHLEAGRSFTGAFRAPINKQVKQNKPVGTHTITATSPIATPSSYQQLDNSGQLFTPNQALSPDSPDYHATSIEGQYYKIQDTITFYLGDNPSYYFGQQYREVHAKRPDESYVASNNQYKFKQHTFLEEDKIHFDPTLNTPFENQVGINRKLFGNRYNLHDGHIVTIRKSDQGPHKTINYGARYIENIVDDSQIATNSMVEGFPPEHIPTMNDYVVRTHHKHFKIHHNETVTIQNGNSYIKRDGDTMRIQNNGSSTVEINGTTRDKTINVTGHSKKHITADSIEAVFKTSNFYKALYGNSKTETYGSDNAMVLGAKTSLVVGPIAAVEIGVSDKNIIGAKLETILGLKFEGVIGPITKWAACPESKIGPGNITKEGFSLKDAEVEIKKVKADLQATRVSVTNALLTIIG